MDDRWFLTADDLQARRQPGAPTKAAFGWPRNSLAAAAGLREFGHDFIVAPVPSLTGDPVVAEWRVLRGLVARIDAGS